jgi:hypothetical protein
LRNYSKENSLIVYSQFLLLYPVDECPAKRCEYLIEVLLGGEKGEFISQSVLPAEPIQNAIENSPAERPSHPPVLLYEAQIGSVLFLPHQDAHQAHQLGVSGGWHPD